MPSNTPTATESTICLHESFPRFEPGRTAMPVWCVTPNEGRVIHRFFDTSPFSPSGRYLAAFRLPFEDRTPKPADVGQIVLIDLQSGEENVVATTRGWECQMGANLNWGGDDQTLVFNDVDVETWRPQVVRLNPHTGEAQRWPGGVYHVSPDGRYAAAASMEKMRRTQYGYGVLLPDEHVGRNVGAVEDDGLFFTDLQTGERKLVLSLVDAARVIPELREMTEAQRNEWEIYGFHCKWCPDGHRLIFTVRRYRHRGLNRFNAFEWKRHEPPGVRFDVLTLRPDGSDVHDAVPAKFWEKGGHHINFFPDGDRLSMNLGHFRDGGLDLVQVDHDGSNLKKITDAADGSGHPTVHPDGRHILTDTYTHERWTVGETTPLRWIDLAEGKDRELVRMTTQPPALPAAELRVDPHPAWDRSWRRVAFNAVIGGTRRVLVADMQPLL